MHRRTFMIGLCAGTALWMLPPAAYSQSPIHPPTGRLTPDAVTESSTRAFYSEVTLDANGDGTQVFEHRVKAIGTKPVSGAAWTYKWPAGVYREVRAWDADGPLEVKTRLDDGVLEVVILFPHELTAGQQYTYWLTATVGSVGEKQHDGSWRAYWYVHAGSIPSFRHTMILPVNTVIDRAEPGWTARDANRVTWAYEGSASADGFTVYVYYQTSTTAAAPLYLQTDPAWDKDPYGRYDPVTHPADNIRRWGCALCCAAMVISAYGEQQGAPGATPKTLNAYLRADGFQGYSAGNGVIWAYVTAFAKDQGIPLRFYPFPGGDRNQAFDTALASGDLIIAGVNNGGYGHFVLITGKTTFNGRPTYAINDPYHGKTTLYQRYGDATTSLLFFTVRPVNRANLAISAHSPVEFVVTDPAGRKAGYDPRTGTTVDEIPGAVYETIELGPSDGAVAGVESSVFPQMMIPAPEDGEYTTEVIGTGSGDYTLQLVASNWEGDVTQSSVTGTIELNQVDAVAAAYDEVVGVVGPELRLYLPSLQG